MTTDLSTASTLLEKPSTIERILDKIPGATLLKNLNIGLRLMMGFGLLVAITLLAIGFSYFGSVLAKQNIDVSGEVRVPATLASSSAQANLLLMLADVRGYLALGDSSYRDSYAEARQNFEADLAELEALSTNFNLDNKVRLVELQVTFDKWSKLPDRLFALRDDQLDREPAYRLLATEGTLKAGNVLIGINQLIEDQSQRTPSRTNSEMLGDMANFQGSFAAMYSALRGYVTTRNRIFRQEYEVNLAANDFAWQRLQVKKNQLNGHQLAQFEEIAANRAAFLEFPSQIFELLEGEQWREDLYLFSTEAVPLADDMQQKLNALTQDQQTFLEDDLNQGIFDLDTANQRSAMVGIAALIIGAFLAFVFRENIAGPIRRLTHVADQIRHGDLEAQAHIESKDEIGTLAKTFNNMTTKLRDTLFQVTREKERADGLLDVVIPIGVQLSSEKNFNRLLEKMLLEAKAFCHADSGTLYLRTADEELEAVIVNNTSIDIQMGGTSGNEVTLANIPLKDNETGATNTGSISAYTVLSGEAINVPDRSQDKRFQETGSHIFKLDEVRYRSVSYLSIPLKKNDGYVIGAMQLVNAQDPETSKIIPFDTNIQQLMESYSSLAVAALEAYQREQKLRQEITQLKIQIDESKREQSVQEIVEGEGFAELQARAESMRRRRRKRRRKDKDSE
ncbi:HAMP domain-containing protein [Anaerolineales bacterium HSG6]|nr:HAMP domain-containing protein [Anaerolineales bacterium HSG6]MDM8531502.1 HAMP domain-containing protein [Anaerolineales bacterium HSG25]